MLIGFQVENFKSFKARQTLSLVANRYREHWATNTIKPEVPGVDQLLRTAVIYGANAAGKTNLMRAVEFMKTFVVRSAANTDAPCPYNPFKLARSTAERPSQFSISFVQEGTRYDYAFSLSLDRIESERLDQLNNSGNKLKRRMLFDRQWNGDSREYDWRIGDTLKGQRSVWQKSTRPNALFLSTAIQLNNTQLLPVFEWFQKRLHVIVGETQLNQTLTFEMLDAAGGKQLVLPFLQQADLGIAGLEIEREHVPSGAAVIMGPHALIRPGVGGAPASVMRVRLAHQSEDFDNPVTFSLDEESSGTLALFRMAGAWLNVLKNGEVLLVDEIDQNMHPTLLQFLISMFHASKINRHNAQLVCNTHSTALLDRKSCFRRDQIWFVEKELGGASKLYPLSDFRPRDDEVIEDWYKRGRYGAQPMLPGLE